MEELCSENEILLGFTILLSLIVLAVIIFVLTNAVKGIIKMIKGKIWLEAEEESSLVVCTVFIGLPIVLYIIGYLFKLIMC